MSLTQTHDGASVRRQEYLDILMDELRRSEPRVLRRWHQIGSDFLDDAASQVWLKMDKYDPEKGPFRPWCRSVLRNLLFSRGRAVRTRRRLESSCTPAEDGRTAVLSALPGQEDPELEARTHEMNGFLTKPFTDAEMRTIAAWPAADRVILLCLAGLWRKVSKPTWSRWVQEASAHSNHIRAELPLSELSQLEDRLQRTALLAEAWQVPRNRLSQQWRRKGHWIEDLPCIQQLLVAA